MTNLPTNKEWNEAGFVVHPSLISDLSQENITLHGFTPGPWEARIGGGGCNVAVNSTMLAPIEIPINPHWLATHPELVIEAQYNARLIAAAPTMHAEIIRLRQQNQDLLVLLKDKESLQHQLVEALEWLDTATSEYKHAGQPWLAVVSAQLQARSALAKAKEVV